MPILITTAILCLHTILPVAGWGCKFYLKSMHVQINTNRFALTQPRAVRFWGLSLFFQSRLLPTTWLFPAALEHQNNAVFWFFGINFSRIFLLMEIVIYRLVLFCFWTEFFELPECKEKDFPSLHQLCLWFLKELIHISSHLAWSVFCFPVFSLSASPHCILLPIMI